MTGLMEGKVDQMDKAPHHHGTVKGGEHEPHSVKTKKKEEHTSARNSYPVTLCVTALCVTVKQA